MNADATGDLPTLRTPILVAAFEGWNDAGDAASGAVEHLALIWDAQPLVDIDSDDYYDFQVNRPIVKQIDGVTRRIDWPTTSISWCSPPGSDRDIVLLRGIEPNMRWRGFCAEILDLARALNVQTMVILGALLADAPHTRPVPVTGTAYSTDSALAYNLQESRYEGPTGITGVLQDQCVNAGIPAVSFWAAVPHYVSTPPNPKATVALLSQVEEVLDIEVPLGDLPGQAEEWEQAVTEMTEDDEEIAEYVRGLEERGDAEVSVDDAMSKIDG
ncbi:PAC2 family protein, partial [Williamsia sp.]